VLAQLCLLAAAADCKEHQELCIEDEISLLQVRKNVVLLAGAPGQAPGQVGVKFDTPPTEKEKNAVKASQSSKEFHQYAVATLQLEQARGIWAATRMHLKAGLATTDQINAERAAAAAVQAAQDNEEMWNTAYQAKVHDNAETANATKAHEQVKENNASAAKVTEQGAVKEAAAEAATSVLQEKQQVKGDAGKSAWKSRFKALQQEWKANRKTWKAKQKAMQAARAGTSLLQKGRTTKSRDDAQQGAEDAMVSRLTAIFDQQLDKFTEAQDELREASKEKSDAAAPANTAAAPANTAMFLSENTGSKVAVVAAGQEAASSTANANGNASAKSATAASSIPGEFDHWAMNTEHALGWSDSDTWAAAAADAQEKATARANAEIARVEASVMPAESAAVTADSAANSAELQYEYGQAKETTVTNAAQTAALAENHLGWTEVDTDLLESNPYVNPNPYGVEAGSLSTNFVNASEWAAEQEARQMRGIRLSNEGTIAANAAQIAAMNGSMQVSQGTMVNVANENAAQASTYARSAAEQNFYNWQLWNLSQGLPVTTVTAAPGFPDKRLMDWPYAAPDGGGISSAAWGDQAAANSGADDVFTSKWAGAMDHETYSHVVGAPGAGKASTYLKLRPFPHVFPVGLVNGTTSEDATVAAAAEADAMARNALADAITADDVSNNFPLLRFGSRQNLAEAASADAQAAAHAYNYAQTADNAANIHAAVWGKWNSAGDPLATPPAAAVGGGFGGAAPIAEAELATHDAMSAAVNAQQTAASAFPGDGSSAIYGQ
jgi:hypothetical protein